MPPRQGDTMIHQPQGKHVLFYNVFFGKDKKGQQFIDSILKDQLNQITSYVGSNATLFYNTIGMNRSVDCPPQLDCRHLYHHGEGFEHVTLQSLYNHCQDNPNDIATYLHNKGSFSTSGHHSKSLTRRIATRSALSLECLLSSQNTSCNVCGMAYTSMPYMHFSANMWTATCGYVQNLVPPLEYNERRVDLCKKWDPSSVHDISHTFCPEKVDNVTTAKATYGLGRYSAERWVVSHPDFVPCQVFHLNIGKHCKPDCGDWNPRLKLGEGKKRVTPYHWQRLSFQLYECEMLYQRRYGEYCKQYYRDFATNFCTFKDFNMSATVVRLD